MSTTDLTSWQIRDALAQATLPELVAEVRERLTDPEVQREIDEMWEFEMIDARGSGGRHSSPWISILAWEKPAYRCTRCRAEWINVGPCRACFGRTEPIEEDEKPEEPVTWHRCLRCGAEFTSGRLAAGDGLCPLCGSPVEPEED